MHKSRHILQPLLQPKPLLIKNSAVCCSINCSCHDDALLILCQGAFARFGYFIHSIWYFFVYYSTYSSCHGSIFCKFSIFRSFCLLKYDQNKVKPVSLSLLRTPVSPVFPVFSRKMRRFSSFPKFIFYNLRVLSLVFPSDVVYIIACTWLKPITPNDITPPQRVFQSCPMEKPVPRKEA